MPSAVVESRNMEPGDGWEVSRVVLEKTSSRQGFGIAISGGQDNPHFKTGDISIIVSDIVKGSPADGLLRIGDILLSVNERTVDGGTHYDAVQNLKAAGMQARLEIKRPAPRKLQKDLHSGKPHLQEADTSTPRGSPKADSERGRARKKPREMEQESTEKKRSHSRSRNRDDEENGERRSRSKNREDGEGGEKKERRSRSRNREEGENGEKKERRSRSRNREEGENGEKKERRSRSRNREEGENGEKKERRSRSHHRDEEGGEGGEKKRSRSKSREGGERSERKSRGRSKSRSRDDLTRTKSKESLHRSKSKSRDNLIENNTVTVVLNRGNQGYGFSLGQHIFIKDLAKDSPADNAENLEKGDIVQEINGTKLDNLKISECIDIIRGATEQVTLTIVKKPKTKDTTDSASKPKSTKPSRPAEAPEAEVQNKEKDEEPAEKPVAKSRKKKEEIEVQPRYEQTVENEPPPLDETEKLNETADSWANASPNKERMSSNDSQQSPLPPPSQEVENMDAKLERLKGQRKFERRLSEMPNARVISFHKTGSVGIQVAGGNALGIYVAAIRADSAAAQEGLKPGDQIIMCNEIDFEDITREEAVLILLALPDDVTLIVESKKETFEQIKKELGDNFFIRTNFDHVEKANPNELVFRKGEIFNVRDTMYQGLIGYWQAQKVGKNAQMLERGVLPNKSRAEQLAIAQKMEERQASTPGRSRVKRKGSIGGTLKKQKFFSQDRLDESSFAEGVQIPAYERVVLKVADFMRPVVILGALGDLVRLKLLEEMPDRFEMPTPTDLSGRNLSGEPYGSSINLSEIRNVIAKNKHCLLDITPEGIEMLMYAQLCPIVILLKSLSRSAVREMRQSLVKELQTSPTGVPGFDGDPLNGKQVKKVFSNAKKVEEFYPHIFTAKINTHVANEDALSRQFYYKLKEVIFNQQAQSAWMPEEKPDEMLDDMVFHPPNYQSYMSGADSDTEGESTTSSPVLARKHYEEEESPLASPIEETAPPVSPPEEVKEAPKKRERSKDRRSKDREESGDRHHHRHRREKSKDRGEKKDKRDRENVDSPPDFKPERPPSREPPSDVRDSPRAQPRVEEPLRSYDHQDDYRDSPRSKHRDDYMDDYGEPPRDDYRRDAPRDNRGPPQRDYDDRYDRAPPLPLDRHIRNTVEEHVNADFQNDQYEQPEEFSYGRGPSDPVHDIPALRDPQYELPEPMPDSPPSRRPPEVRAKPNVNAVRVVPSELKSSMDEKRKSLKRVPNDEALDSYGSKELPPYRPPPPASSDDEVPTKVLTLQERMSKFQQKVTSNAPRPPPPAIPPNEEDVPPPARPVAPRNYVIDTRNRNGPRQEVYVQNAQKPKPQYGEVTRLPQKGQIDEPYVNMRNDKPLERAPQARYPGYDYVKPNFETKPANPYSHSSNTYDVPQHGRNTHNANTRPDGYSVPPSYGRDYTDDDYPPYQVPNATTNGNHDANDGDDEPRVIATARGVFDHKGGLLESQETNVSIYIPAGALPEGRKQEVYFKVCQDSKHMPPLDSTSGETLLSPLVMCGPHGLKFRKPIELRLPHKGASNDSMAFSLKSSDSPIGHPSQWRNVKLGGKDLDSGRAYQVTDDTVSVLVDHF